MTNFEPIASYGLLADCNSAALVSSNGSIDWLCFPRYDSPSVFGKLLDPEAGHWSIHPVASSTTERRYEDETLTIEDGAHDSGGHDPSGRCIGVRFGPARSRDRS